MNFKRFGSDMLPVALNVALENNDNGFTSLKQEVNVKRKRIVQEVNVILFESAPLPI